MSSIIGLLLAVLILTVCICLHEWGHMTVARKFGVGIVEYSVGMGRLLWWKRKGDTVYSIRALPLGGYCALYGEQSLEAEGKGEEAGDGDGKKKKTGPVPDYKTDWKPEQALQKASAWQRILIYIAGPGMNFVLGVLACVVLVGFTRFPSVAVIDSTMDGHPAEQCDIQKGDIVAGINGRQTLTWLDYQEYQASHPREMEDGWDLILFRDGEYHTVRATRHEDGFFGINIIQEPVDLTPSLFVLYTWDAGTYMVRSVVDSLGMLVRGDAALSDMSGIIGVTASMGNIVDDAVENVDEYSEDHEDVNKSLMVVQSVFTSAMFMLAVITVNLGIMNLLPIPALDGGRVLFALIEKLIRRPIPEQVEYVANAVSMIMVLCLMGYVCINDIWKILMASVGA